MTRLAVVAHRDKTLGGGLPQLRSLLADRGFPDPLWYEAAKSKRTPRLARRAIEEGADLVFVWGGDGTVQRCVDVVAGSPAALAILPAGTANLLATNLQIPIDLPAAVDVGLHGARRVIDLGVLNGERFAVMAGAGFDAKMMKGAQGTLKDRFGRVAYVWSGIRATRGRAERCEIAIDGKRWFKGRATCVLLANMGTLSGGIRAFRGASPNDGKLDVGVVTASGPVEWARVLSRVVTGHPDRSRFTQMTAGTEVDIRFARPMLYELDGGARGPERRLRAKAEPAAVTICVPEVERL